MSIVYQQTGRPAVASHQFIADSVSLNSEVARVSHLPWPRPLLAPAIIGYVDGLEIHYIT